MADSGRPQRQWKPVRDQAADSFWLLLIASQSITVLATRVYLELTGYPQVGDSTYHVAHVLWGGLLLSYAQSRELQLATQPNLAERLVEGMRGTLANRPAKWMLKTILVIGCGLLGAAVHTVEAAIQRTARGQFALFAGPFAGLLDLTGVMIQIA